MPVIYCDRTDCVYNCRDECQRTIVKIESDASYLGAYCVSAEKKKASSQETGKEK